MIIRNTGRICSNFYATGWAATPVYLLDGDTPVLFDGGFTAFSRHYEQDIKHILNGRTPAFLFLTHSHFDHLGAASYFKKLWPDLKVCASERCKDILSNKKALNLIKKLNKDGAGTMKKMGISPIFEAPFETFTIDNVLSPGETIRLSDDLTVVALNTPGHTWDFFSYWIPEQKILIASEAVACFEYNDYIQTEFLVSFDAYLESLNTLKSLGAKVLTAGHHASFTEEHAAKHINDSIKAAHDFSAMVQNFLEQEKGDIHRAVLKVKAVEWDPRPWPKQPEHAYLLNLTQRVKMVFQRMNQT